MAEEHETVLLSILATLVAGVLMLLGTVAVTGTMSVELFEIYVLPLLMSALALVLFWALLFARHLGRLPLLTRKRAKEGDQPTAKAE
ncbi:MAG: hypothetical protein JRM80_11065 [Nitrososphaerota archaeon]|nr:hypothetical protein [Nitrososphaerota archaeon]